MSVMTAADHRIPKDQAELLVTPGAYADGRIHAFREKPRSEHWINGGFFCFEARALDYIAAGGDEAVLERTPLEGLARDGELRAHRHEGFWECMDTYKDAVALNDLWDSGAAPWRNVPVMPPAGVP